jgi:NADH:ubiquinone oxidoreductase subunit E
MDIEELKKHQQQLMNVLPHSQACLLPLIRLIASSEHEVTEDMQAALAQTCDVPREQVSRLVLAFQQRGEQQGSIRVCGDLICALHCAQEVIDTLHASAIPAVVSGCFGYCYAAPAVQKPDGKFYKVLLDPAIDAVDKAVSPSNPVLVRMSQVTDAQGEQE